LGRGLASSLPITLVKGTAGQVHHGFDVDGVGSQTAAPPEKLTLAFATADVMILGWRFSTLAIHLRDEDLPCVRSLANSYAHFDSSKAFVASITVTSISKE
jgi:hypothetical protein